MAHGKIHQDNQANCRTNNPGFHLPVFLGHRIFLCLLWLFTGNTGMVSRFLHRLDDFPGHCFVRRFHLHGSCQEIHICPLHPRHLTGDLLNPCRASGTSHTGYGKFKIHHHSLLSGINLAGTDHIRQETPRFLIDSQPCLWYYFTMRVGKNKYALICTILPFLIPRRNLNGKQGKLSGRGYIGVDRRKI